MEKETKNTLTRDFVEKELRFYNMADIRSNIAMSGSLALLLLPLTLGIVYGLFALFENVFLKVILSVAVGVLLCSPIIIYLWKLRKSIKEKDALERGDFDIVMRKVIAKSEKNASHSTDEFLHFNDLKEVSVEHTVFQLASEGDEFYVVHYKNQDSIKLLYPAKMYEYKER